uniref:Uncharacterized protein n=1 Tax=Globodera pallida TaxID=36090 RepID=A0A183BQJ2_GLOPA
MSGFNGTVSTPPRANGRVEWIHDDFVTVHPQLTCVLIAMCVSVATHFSLFVFGRLFDFLLKCCRRRTRRISVISNGHHRLLCKTKNLPKRTDGSEGSTPKKATASRQRSLRLNSGGTGRRRANSQSESVAESRRELYEVKKRRMEAEPCRFFSLTTDDEEEIANSAGLA